MKKCIEIIGWYGAFAILLAYALLSFGTISSNSYAYQLLNLTGAVGIIVVSFAKNARQPALLNIVWAIVALVSIISMML